LQKRTFFSAAREFFQLFDFGVEVWRACVVVLNVGMCLC